MYLAVRLKAIACTTKEADLYNPRDILPPPKRWGLLAQCPYRAKYQRAIPVCPTVLLILSGYAVSIRFPSFLILMAALTSRSCLAPHSGQIQLLTDRSFVPAFR